MILQKKTKNNWRKELVAEKKKTASKSQDKKENKNLAKENKVKNTKKKAVSTKKDTAKVVSKKKMKMLQPQS